MGEREKRYGRGGEGANHPPTIITAASAVTLYYVEGGDKFSKVRKTIPRRNCRGGNGDQLQPPRASEARGRNAAGGRASGKQ